MQDEETLFSAIPLESSDVKPIVTLLTEKALEAIPIKSKLPPLSTDSASTDSALTSPVSTEFSETASTNDQSQDLSYTPTEVSSTDYIDSPTSINGEKIKDHLESIHIVDEPPYSNQLSSVETIEIHSSSATEFSVSTVSTSLSESSTVNVVESSFIEVKPSLSDHEQKTKKIRDTLSIDILQTYQDELSEQEKLTNEAVQQYHSSNAQVSKLKRQLENLDTTEKELIDSIVPKLSSSITSNVTISALTSLSSESQEKLIKSIGKHLSDRLLENIEYKRMQDGQHKIDTEYSKVLSRSNQETLELKKSRDFLKIKLGISIDKMLGPQVDKNISSLLIEIISSRVSQGLIEPASNTELENIRKAVIKNLSRQIKRGSVLNTFSSIVPTGEKASLQSSINDLERIRKDKQEVEASMKPIQEKTTEFAVAANSVNQQGMKSLKFTKLISDQQLLIIESFALPIEVKLYGDKFNKQLQETLLEKEEISKRKADLDSQRSRLTKQIKELEAQLKSNKASNEKTKNKLMIKLGLKKQKPEFPDRIELLQKTILELDKKMTDLNPRIMDLNFKEHSLLPLIAAIKKQEDKLEQRSKLSEPETFTQEILSKLTDGDRHQILIDSCLDKTNPKGLFQLKSPENFKSQNLIGCKLVCQELSEDAKTETRYYKLPGLKNLLDISGQLLGTQGTHILTLETPALNDNLKVGDICDLKVDKAGKVTAVNKQRSKSNSISNSH